MNIYRLYTYINTNSQQQMSNKKFELLNFHVTNTNSV